MNEPWISSEPDGSKQIWRKNGPCPVVEQIGQNLDECLMSVDTRIWRSVMPWWEQNASSWAICRIYLVEVRTPWIMFCWLYISCHCLVQLQASFIYLFWKKPWCITGLSWNTFDKRFRAHPHQMPYLYIFFLHVNLFWIRMNLMWMKYAWRMQPVKSTFETICRQWNLHWTTE